MTARSATSRDGRPAATGERYLLFAGTQLPPNGDLGDPLDIFTSEEAARRAFREVRLRMSSPSSWAQLAVVDDRNGCKAVCWFGIGAEPQRKRPAASASTTRPATKAAERPRRPPLFPWLLAHVRRTGGQGRRRSAA